ncbi:MAG TPA: hypothetical protein PKE69_08480 [Pyrinomonadaceae bacterium]|mgnify:CR=1 FL=1|nr:hypothetical protein [Pyrinomonadaceae bacterium]
MAEEANEQAVVNEDGSVTVKINFRIPSRMPSVYAHHMFIQPDESEVVLSFFEIVNPVVPPEKEEQYIKMLQETGIQAECVARVTVANSRFPRFVSAMVKVAENLQAIENQHKGESNANDTADNKES